MVGPIDDRGRQGDIPIRVPDNDSGHVAHSIKSATVEINGNRTNFLAEPFHDRIFVLVTQNQKMGTIVSTRSRRSRILRDALSHVDSASIVSDG